MLSLDINLVFTIINLLIWVIIIKKFLFAPVDKILKARQASVQEQFDKADKQKAEAESLKKEYEGILQNVDDERREAIKKAKAEAQNQYDVILKDADARADEIIKKAKAEARTEYDKIIKSADSEISDMVISAAKKIVLSDEANTDDEKLYEKFLNKENGEAGND